MHSIGSRCVTGPENILFVGASKHLSALKFYRLGQQRGWKEEERNWTVAVCYSLDKPLTFFLFALLCYIQTIVSILLDTPLPPTVCLPYPKIQLLSGLFIWRLYALCFDRLPQTPGAVEKQLLSVFDPNSSGLSQKSGRLSLYSVGSAKSNVLIPCVCWFCIYTDVCLWHKNITA